MNSATLPSSVVTETALPGLELISRGKVRDIYKVDEERLLMVATDRISAFDVVLPTPILRKGEVLTTLAWFWLEKLLPIVSNHLIAKFFFQMPQQLQPYKAVLEKRSMLVWRAEVFPVECIVRGYLSGSGWKDYLRTGEVCGHPLPKGLKESEQLPEPIFAPSTKAEQGHDENISIAHMAEIVGAEVTDRLKEHSLRLYDAASKYALSRGIIIADTKFEFGLDKDGQIMLIDELFTPDSSRFWPIDGYQPGKSQPSFDKQYVRDYLEGIGWNKQPPAPELPPEVVEATTNRYLEACRRITDFEL